MCVCDKNILNKYICVINIYIYTYLFKHITYYIYTQPKTNMGNLNMLQNGKGEKINPQH